MEWIEAGCQETILLQGQKGGDGITPAAGAEVHRDDLKPGTLGDIGALHGFESEHRARGATGDLFSIICKQTVLRMESPRFSFRVHNTQLFTAS